VKWNEPPLGTIRERVIFAWRPILCDDGFKRWLCRLKVREMFTGRWKRMSAMPAGGGGDGVQNS